MKHQHLQQLETWFVHAMTHGEDAAEGTAEASREHGAPMVDAMLTSSSMRSALERFSVYHHAYRARLHECLADDYPVLASALAEAFEPLCQAYVAQHPSRTFSLNAYGAALPDFVRTRALAPLYVELARLEWSLVEAIHAPRAEALRMEDVAAIPQAAWEHAVLVPSPSLQVHRFEHPINAFYKKIRFRESGDALPELPAAGPSDLAVCRRELTVWRVDLSPAGAHALTALRAGTPLLAALTQADARPEDVSQWFRTWVECGFFSAVHTRG